LYHYVTQGTSKATIAFFASNVASVNECLETGNAVEQELLSSNFMDDKRHSEQVLPITKKNTVKVCDNKVCL
jgi:hypothetical protein